MSKPIVSMIFAMDRQRLIGKDNKLPWRLPADLAYFMRMTMGHCVVMGRKTFESLANPLSGRTNIIITRDRTYEAPEGCIVVHAVEEALEKVTGEEFFVIGGTEIYSLFLPLADRLYVTEIDEEFTGDAYFPEFDIAEWRTKSMKEGTVDDHNPYPHRFIVFERKR